MTSAVWIVCRDYGCEGLREPFLAFDSEEAARAFAKACDDLGATCLKVVCASKFTLNPPGST